MKTTMNKYGQSDFLYILIPGSLSAIFSIEFQLQYDL